ncbi:MAG: PKD domain-containing protein [Acidobacteriota bacterium]|nr:PKD domain-containing protein [Acidobacteriota bacterium]
MESPNAPVVRIAAPGVSALVAHPARLLACLLVVVAISAGCSKSPTAPSPSPQPTPANSAPTISTMTVAQSAYRTARITATTGDGDGQVASGTVDWGDGSTTNLTSGVTSVNTTHRYGRAQAYSVTLRVVDDDGAQAQLTRSVSITVPPEACLGIEVVELCARSTSDFKNMEVAVRAGDVSLARATVSDGNPSIALPLAAGFGRLTLAHNFTTGRLIVSGEVCPVPFLVCKPVGSKTIQF